MDSSVDRHDDGAPRDRSPAYDTRPVLVTGRGSEGRYRFGVRCGLSQLSYPRMAYPVVRVECLLDVFG